MSLMSLYYNCKPLIPRNVQIFLRRRLVSWKQLGTSGTWPLFDELPRTPMGWTGWPEGRKFALVLTHDVDTVRGHDRCVDLMRLERERGFRSSFNFVPERYDVSPDLRAYVTGNGFEVGVHDLNHDGKLYKSKKIFQERATKINEYLRNWNAVGFRSGSMHHNLEWIHDLNLVYDLSTFDFDPFEPQSDGYKTIFPFWVPKESSDNGYVEIPYTMPQDFTLFVLLRESGIEVWKRKLEWVAERGGMVLLNTHPDYMNFGARNLSVDEYPVELYREFLDHVRSRYDGEYWHVLPKVLAAYWTNVVADMSVNPLH